MRIEVHAEAERVALTEPTNFTAFAVWTDTEVNARVAALLKPIGRLADDRQHAFISRKGLCALAGEFSEDEEWLSSLDSMISYAKTKGWLDQDGSIRAHVVVSGEGPTA